ncbi:Xaa-Pro dipeptidyl-peptidase [Streptosporangium sp. NPDC087985]|uniref:Xaa-Pro dipeptidyl-peptidase n=1 Tax=Streptosporangium sp. NPDC087985 TaxID=3366196 RepID=UPI0038149619
MALYRGRLRARAAAAAICAGVLTATVLTATGVANAQPKAGPIFSDGQAQIVPEFSDSSQWIRQQLWVETEFDTDGDGKRDRVHVDVTRPRQTETEGLKVPVIYETSPYYAGTASTNSQYLWNVSHELGAVPPPRTSPPLIPFQANRTSVSTSMVSTWVPRGFAVVHSDSPGTGLSQGCPTVGAPNESLAPKAVIDWMNGRAKGYTAVDGGDEVVATGWSTGKVGMTGTSYNGTLPLAAATTGVDGLEAIIPVAPNTSYYHYYRSNGLVRNPGGWPGEDIDFLFDYISSGYPDRRAYCAETVRVKEMNAHQDRVTGDYNDFWAGRDYLNQLDKVKAATLMAHAFNDWNVVPEHSVRIYEALKAKGIPLQAYFHQGGHGGNPPLVMTNKWFTRYLYGVQNGVENDPKAWVAREAEACPPRTATVVGDQANAATLKVADTSQIPLGFTLTVPQTNANGTVTNTTRVVDSIPDSTTLVLASPVATAAGQRVANGTTVSIACSAANPTPYADYPNPAASQVTFQLQPGGNTAGGLTSLAKPGTGNETLVDAGNTACNAGTLATQQSENRLLYTTPVLTAPMHLSGTPQITVRLASSKPAANLSVALVRLPWTGASGCTSSTQGTSTSIITRGWADPQNHSSLTYGEPLTPGRFYDVTFPLEPTDKVLQPGQQLGLMIFSTDAEFTLRPQPGTRLTVDLAGTSVKLPVVGGPLAVGICPADSSKTVVIGGVDSGVQNRVLAGTCTIRHHILDQEKWKNHGQFVSHVGDVADQLAAADLISGRDRGALVSAAARSNIGK